MEAKKAASKRARRTYSTAERESILATAAAQGVMAAARLHGVPEQTISTWRARAASRPGEATAVEPAAQAGSTPRSDELARARKGRRYSPAEKKLILEASRREGPAAAGAKHGCSTWSIRRWTRDEARARSAPADPVDASEAEYDAEQAERRKLVLEVWRTNPGFGPSQVRNQLKRQGYRVSVHTVRDVMTAHGYIAPGLRPKAPAREFEAVRPMQLYHLDFVQFFVHRQRQSLLLIEDDFSRFVPGWALLKSEHADGVLDAFDAAIHRYGKPEGVMVDRGAAFYAWNGVARFERYVTEADIDYFPVDEPAKNGKLERLNATVRKELLTQVEFADLDDARHRIATWMHGYNYRRTHMALGGLLVPADRFHGMAEDALRRIEQGNGASPLDVLAPAGRALEIFRVVSVAGQVAVYLMGQKVFG